MSEMVERVARAMIRHLRPALHDGGPDLRDVDIDISSLDFIELTRVAIASMREPTEAMTKAGNTAPGLLCWSLEPGEGLDEIDIEVAWHGMIDEALR